MGGNRSVVSRVLHIRGDGHAVLRGPGSGRAFVNPWISQFRHTLRTLQVRPDIPVRNILVVLAGAGVIAPLVSCRPHPGAVGRLALSTIVLFRLRFLRDAIALPRGSAAATGMSDASVPKLGDDTLKKIGRGSNAGSSAQSPPDPAEIVSRTPVQLTTAAH